MLLAFVTRLLYVTFEPGLRVHLEQLSAQRAVFALRSPGFGVDAEDGRATAWRSPPTARSNGHVIVRARSPTERLADRWRAAFSTPVISPPTTGPAGWVARQWYADGDDLVYLGPLTNSAGRERIVCLRVTTFLHNGPSWSPGFSVDVRDRVGWFSREERIRSSHTAGNDLLPHARPLHLDPPRLDPTSSRRLLLDGTAGGERFAFELMLDAADRVQIFDLLNRPASIDPTTQDSTLLPIGD